MDSEDDFDPDFVSYTPLSRKRVLSPPSTSKKSVTFGSLKKSPPKLKISASQGNVYNGRKPKLEPKLSLKKQPAKPPVKRKITDSANANSKIKKTEDAGYCPSCQMPWTYYKASGKLMDLHIDKCLSIDLNSLPECRNGTTCNEVREDHFWKFSHLLLANVRARGISSKLKFEHVYKHEPEVLLKIKTEVEDPNFGNAADDTQVPGPSGWNMKNIESVNSDEALSESCSTVHFGGVEEVPVVDMSRVEQFDMEDALNEPEMESIASDSGVTLERNARNLPRSGEKIYEKRTTNFTKECGPSNHVVSADVHIEESVSNRGDTEDGDRCSASPGILIDSGDELMNSLVDQALDKYLNECEESKEIDRRSVNKSEKVPAEPPQTPIKSIKSHSSSQEKKCVHLHFHISPGKSKKRSANQPSILDFFLPKKKSPSENGVTPEPMSPGTIKKDDLKGPQAWNSFMNRMKQKGYSIPSVTQTTASQPSEQGSKKSQYGQGSGWQQRKCPFYKFIPDTSFVVDAFNYGYQDGVKAYFLTHFHYDHFRGLSKHFCKPVYCNEITGNLVRERLKLPDKYLHILPMEEPAIVCGVEVTLLEANHCPGAAMILFKLITGQTILHVGDFRAHPKMESYPALWNNPVHTLYLDTTYCNPMYCFPSQEEVLEKCVLIAENHNRQNPRSVFAVGSYTIGKERVFKAIAGALDCRIWVTADKLRTLKCIKDQEILSRITPNKLSAKVHVLSMKDMNPRTLNNYIATLKPQFDTVVGIKPTGWEHTNSVSENLEDIQPYKQGNVFLYGIPYSEHSSYSELKRFVQFVQPQRVIPTVNVGNAQVRKKMEADFKKWIQESPFSKFSLTGHFKQMELKLP